MRNLNHFFLLLLLFLVGWLLFEMFKPFLVAIFLAFVLSRLFVGWYKVILGRLRSESWSAILTTTLIFFLIFLPLALLGKLLLFELSNLYGLVSSKTFNEYLLLFQAKLSQYDFLYNDLDLKNFLDASNIQGVSKYVGSFILTSVSYFYQNISHLFFTLVILFFSLYYFFKEGENFIKKIYRISPLPDNLEKKFMSDFTEISRATLKGSLVIAVIQGFLIGLFLFFLKIPSAVLLGLLATIFALVPMVGTAVVWLPVAVVLFVFGRFWEAIALALFGALIVGSVDNILRPYLVGNATRLNALLVFLATLGGIKVFGLAGFLLGPIVVVLFLNLLDIYQIEFNEELEEYNSDKT